MSLDILIDDVMCIIIGYIKRTGNLVCLLTSSKRYYYLIRGIIKKLKNKYRADGYSNSINGMVKYRPQENTMLISIINDMQYHCFIDKRYQEYINLHKDSCVYRLAQNDCMNCGKIDRDIYFTHSHRYFKVTLGGIDAANNVISEITVEYVETCRDCHFESDIDNNVYYFSYIREYPNVDYDIMDYHVKHVKMLSNETPN